MPFIGQQPITGAYHKLDSITTSATATYNLQLNGGAYYPTSANHLLVSLNGVMQAPQDSFTVSGSQITFASALTSSDSIDFIMALGDVLNIGVPSDGAVNTSQLANSAVTDAKIASGISSSKLTGALPAIDGSALTGLDAFTTAEIDLTSTQSITGLPSTWKIMHLSWYNVVSSASGQFRMYLRVGGSSIGSGNYKSSIAYRYTDGTTTFANEGGSQFTQAFMFWGNWGTTTKHEGNATILRNDNGSDYVYTLSGLNSFKDYNSYGGAGYNISAYDASAAVDGLDFEVAGTTFASGKVRIFYQ